MANNGHLPHMPHLGSCCRLCQVGFGTLLLYGAVATLSAVSITWAVSFFYSTLARLGPVGAAVRAALAPLFGRSCVAVHVGQDEWCLVPAYGAAFVAVIVLWMVGHALPLRVNVVLSHATRYSSIRVLPCKRAYLQTVAVITCCFGGAVGATGAVGQRLGEVDCEAPGILLDARGQQRVWRAVQSCLCHTRAVLSVAALGVLLPPISLAWHCE